MCASYLDFVIRGLQFAVHDNSPFFRNNEQLDYSRSVFGLRSALRLERVHVPSLLHCMNDDRTVLHGKNSD